MANRPFYDIVMVGDFRFPGGVATGVAEQIRAQAQAGYRTGLLQINCSVLRYPLTLSPKIRESLHHGLAELLDPDQSIEAGLLIAVHPKSFTHMPSRRLRIRADTKLFVINCPPLDGVSKPNYRWETIKANVENSLGPQILWAPVSPVVRDSLLRLQNPPPLFDNDWVEIIDESDWTVFRRRAQHEVPVIGRHSRPFALKWPEDRDTLLAAYPDDNAFRVRVTGAGSFVRNLLGAYPPNWDLIDSDTFEPKEFLRTLDFFVYFHSTKWVEGFGRVILEALTSRTLAILPSAFEPIYGEAAVYGSPNQVRSLTTEYFADRRRYLRQTHRAQTIVRERFSPQVHVRRLTQLVGPPRKKAHSATRGRSTAPCRTLFMTSNGIGMGHLTRMLAIARRCSSSIIPVFVTLSQAAKVVKQLGYLAEYIPNWDYLQCNNSQWNQFLHQELNEIISFYRITTLVFDGNVPYTGLMRTMQDNPSVIALWCRRAMWRPGAGKETIVRRETDFHGVIEPGDLAGVFDEGLTTKHRKLTRVVDPIVLLSDDEILDRDSAQRSLGLDSTKTNVLVQLGAGNNFDYSEIRSTILDKLTNEQDVQVIIAQWLISDAKTPLPDKAISLSSYPLGRYFKAFDFSISAAGYNSFHELLLTGTPTIFVPNENMKMDEQLSRAKFAEQNGLGLCLRASEVFNVTSHLELMLDPDFREEVRSQCNLLSRTNGALEAAQLIDELSRTVRADLPPKRFWNA